MMTRSTWNTAAEDLIGSQPRKERWQRQATSSVIVFSWICFSSASTSAVKETSAGVGLAGFHKSTNSAWTFSGSSRAYWRPFVVTARAQAGRMETPSSAFTSRKIASTRLPRLSICGVKPAPRQSETV